MHLILIAVAVAVVACLAAVTGAWATRRHLRRATEERASIVVHILDEALGILDGAGVADSVVART
ncbi:MAG: hypothetical protein ACYDB7_04105, partial [Mycobacteriales bacterium]